MSKTTRTALTWAVVASLSVGTLGMAAPVQAQSLNAAAGAMGDHVANPVVKVQWGPYRRPPPPPPHGRWGNPYWRNGGWYYRDNSGAWVAAGIAGLALGAMAGAAAANANRQPQYVPSQDPNAVAYCARTYRSYNPNTGTYTGYDGLQHPCP